MKYDDLMKKHPLYDAYSSEWMVNNLCYEGGEDFIRMMLFQHSRESVKNWQERMKEGYGFQYGEAIVDLFNYYLFEKPFQRELGLLSEDQQWKMFEQNCDLMGTNYNTFLTSGQKLASVTGAVGVLVNKYSPGGQRLTLNEEIKRRIYPYCAHYTLPNIFDWRFEKDPETGYPKLTMLKLKEDSDDRYTIWYPDHWEVYEIVNGKREVVEVDVGENPLQEIPFLWMQNIERLGVKLIGKSDLNGVTDIVGSIIRNLSCGEEVIKFAGFPMMRKPMARADEEGNPAGGAATDVSGPRAVQEFDPELGEAGKPDWMEPVIKEAVEAILLWIDRKADEIYRVKHLSGVHGQRKSNNEVASGLALRYEFQQLNAVLQQKGQFMMETDLGIIRLWCKWQGKEEVAETAKVFRTEEYSVEDLSVALENLFTAQSKTRSETFSREIEKRTVRMTLPGISEAKWTMIESEIDSAAAPMAPFDRTL